MTTLSEGRIIRRIQWNQDICSLKLGVSSCQWQPGQRLAIGLPDTPVHRLQHFFLTNLPEATYPEICVQRLPDNPLSNQLFHLQPGDSFCCHTLGAGGFSLDQVPAADYLWLLAMDAGIAPFLSILRAPDAWAVFEKIILVQQQSIVPEVMLYEDVLRQLQQHHPEQLVFHYLSAAPDNRQESLQGALSEVIASGELEESLGINLDPATGRIMLCAPGENLAGVLRALAIHHNYPVTAGRGNVLSCAYDNNLQRDAAD